MRDIDHRGEDRADRAREPSELLKQLRERLDRLPGNHPSALIRQPDRRPAGEQAVGPESGDGLESGRPQGDSACPPGDEPGAEPEQAEAAEEVAPGRTDTDREGTGGGPADSGADLDALTGVRLAAEGYRPWFMSDGIGAPWFATEPGGPTAIAPGDWLRPPG